MATKDEKRVLDTLAQLGGKVPGQDSILHEGDKLVIPERMSISGAIVSLQRLQAQEEEVISLQKVFKYRPWDGAHAFEQVIRKHFGFMIGVNTGIVIRLTNASAFITRCRCEGTLGSLLGTNWQSLIAARNFCSFQ